MDVQNGEPPKTPLRRSKIALLGALSLHSFPTAINILLMVLCYTERYAFDVQSSLHPVRWAGPLFGVKHSPNDTVKALQFAGKGLEIALVGSMSSMLMHIIRRRLVGQRGLPFGLLSAAYNVLSIRNLWPGGIAPRPGHIFVWFLVLFSGLIANILGPVSNIVLIPSLGWWPMSQPFGPTEYRVYAPLNDTVLWPQVIGEYQTGNNYTLDLKRLACFSSELSLTDYCPASGFDQLQAWTISLGLQSNPPNVTMFDQASEVQRVVSARRAPSSGNSAVMIASSLSHLALVTFGSFWRLVQEKHLPASRIPRPRLVLQPGFSMYQPLVQVQCSSIPLPPDGRLDRSHQSVLNPGINPFSSTDDQSWDLPEWLYDHQFVPDTHVDNQMVRLTRSTNLTWVETPNSNVSIGAVVATPYFTRQPHGTYATYEQRVLLHTCSVDARWIGSSPEYEPSQGPVVSHNVTDPLIFQRPTDPDDVDARTAQMQDYGVRPSFPILAPWADALNIRRHGPDAPSLSQWLLQPQLNVRWANYSGVNDTTVPKASDSLVYALRPTGWKGIEHIPAAKMAAYQSETSEQVATLLSLMVTDGLSRAVLRAYAQSARVAVGAPSDGNITVIDLLGFSLFDSPISLPLSDVQSSRWKTLTFETQRYGYSYSTQGNTIKVGLAFLLLYTAIAVGFMIYILIDYTRGQHWTTFPWSSVTELAALMMNSPPTGELDNTSAGFKHGKTLEQYAWIRDRQDGHLGLVFGSEGQQLDRVQVGSTYPYQQPEVKDASPAPKSEEEV